MTVLSNEARYHFSDFTRDNYRLLLRLAKRHYAVRTFDDLSDARRFIILRHDVDSSLNAALKMARIEQEEGVVATYFLHLHNVLYNVLERDMTGLVSSILACGHKIGLHFDPSSPVTMICFHGSASSTTSL